MNRVVAIGDVHGCGKTLEKLLQDVIKIDKTDKLIFLGDYIDRGPNSKLAVDTILELKDKGYELTCLLGNHEKFLIDALESKDVFNHWLTQGGIETLESFGVKHPGELSEKYLDFFKSLVYYYPYDGYIFVHGGLNFEKEDPLSDFDSMPWIRNQEVDPSKIGGKKIVVGHTPVSLDQIKRSIDSHKIMLDGGCVYKYMRSGLGYLPALDITDNKLYYTENIDV